MPISIRRILFPTDFSDPAKQAQLYAMALADRFGAELHLLHVVPEVTISMPDSSTYWAPPEVDLKAQVEAAKASMVREVGEKWIEEHRTVQTAVVGFVLDEILSYAKKQDIDLIVVGTHGHTGLSHLLLGSVAEKLVRISTCPVLTVHPKGHQFVTADAPS